MTKQPVKVSEYLKQQLALSDKSQKDIAIEAGFNQPNNISMIKDGATKLPINRVPRIAKALGVDQVHLLRLAMREYMPETWEVIESMLGQHLITENEQTLLKIVRKSSRHLELDYSDPKVAHAIESVIERFADTAIEHRKAAVRTADKGTRRKVTTKD